jgi:hypothetical protein
MFSSPYIIPVVAIVGGLMMGAFGAWLKHKEKMSETTAGDSNVNAEIEALKQRVAALETLATDSKTQLRQQIDNL